MKKISGFLFPNQNSINYKKDYNCNRKYSFKGKKQILPMESIVSILRIILKMKKNEKFKNNSLKVILNQTENQLVCKVFL